MIGFSVLSGTTYDSCVPSCAPIDKVENCVRVDEHYFTFHLAIELVRNIDGSSTLRQRLAPCTTGCTCVHYVWNDFQSFFRDTCTF